MKKALIVITLAIFIVGCKKGNISPTNNLEEKLIGRWETYESVYTNPDGQQIIYTFGEDEDDFSTCEYSIGLEYSSGFELQENNVLDLIWCGGNKKQYFHWELTDKQMTIDSGSLVFSVNMINDTIVEFDNNNRSRLHKMIKLN